MTEKSSVGRSASPDDDRQYMLNAIKQHGAIRIYRKNGATARLANDLAVEGFVTMKIIQTDEQSSYLLVEAKAAPDA